MTNSQRKQRGHKIISKLCKVIKIVYQKYVPTSDRAGYAPPIRKRAHVQGLKESRITIRGDDDRGLVTCEGVLTSPVKVYIFILTRDRTKTRCPKVLFRWHKTIIL